MRTFGICTSVAGIAVIGGYFLLRAEHVGKIGEPTDIGGGGLVLTGVMMFLAGLVVLAFALADRRHRR